LFATSAVAQEAPRVVVDIAPVRALVAQIMEGAGVPDQIILAGASPHGYAMRPSEARALEAADLVVWVGPALTHWLEEPLDTLSGQAERITLMDVEGAQSLPFREGQMLEVKEEGHDHDHKEGHDHGDDHDHGHDHDHKEGHDHAHDHGPIDPHGWLSPTNAVLWAGAVAQSLGRMDPANAELYQRNWEALSAELKGLEAEITAQLAPYSDTPFIVLHDGFQYFEASFGVQANAFIIPGDGETPGPATLKALRDYLSVAPAVCAFTEPQENEALMLTAIDGAGTRIAVLDPLGDGEVPYATFLRTLASDMVACLSKG